MELHERRALLKPAPNPGTGRDYVVTLRGTLKLNGLAGETAAIIRYVPDREIVEPENFQHYLTTIQSLEWESLEAAAVAILGDISNELVSRWTQVALKHQPAGDALHEHDISIEDNQPGWHNEDLLYRLPPI